MRKLIFILFLFVAYLIFRPIIGEVWYNVHDTTSIARVYLLEQTLRGGQVPAIWSSLLNEGRGYPLFHFYAPLMSYASLLGKTLTLSYFTGVKIVLILSSLTGMLGMYLLTRRWGRPSALLASLSFALLPYAALDLYVRGAFSEYLALNLLPWIFYTWQDLVSPRKQIVVSLVTTLFLLSHNLIPLITAPFLLVWILLTKPKLNRLILPILLTLGLSAFYLSPLLFERGFVQADRVAKTTDYAKHFVEPTQLWNSVWGFGGSAQGLEDGMSFKVGKIQLILAMLATIPILIKRKKIMLFFVGSTLVVVFMTTSYSAFIWQSLGFLRIVQFPWRFLALVGFFVSILAGYSLTLIHNRLLRYTCLLLAVGGLLFVNLKLFNPQSTFPTDLSLYNSPSYLSTIPDIVPEYLPNWQSSAKPDMRDTMVLPYFYYPTWRVEVEGQPVNTYPTAGGMLAFSNPGQSTNIVVRQGHTTLENISTIISFITLLTLLLYYFSPKLYVKT